jgi:hypothetical protein
MPQLIVNTSSGYIYGLGSQHSLPPAPTPLSSLTPEAFDFSDAQGSWTATDPDGSIMTLDVIQNTDSSFSVLMIDEAAGVCNKDIDSQDPIVFQAEGSGTAIGFYLNLDGITGVCQDTDKTILFDISFTYNPDTDTLLDSYDLIWYRR